VNASPLIFLTKVGLLEVLHQQAVPVLVPDVVMAEISSLGPGDPAVQAVQQAGWIRVVPAPPAPPSGYGNWAAISIDSNPLLRRPGKLRKRNLLTVAFGLFGARFGW